MGAGRLGRLGGLDGGLSAVDGDVAVDDDARFRREEAGHRRLALQPGNDRQDDADDDVDDVLDRGIVGQAWGDLA